jgi:alpha-tubulin suppressor-like RCC1 family protein
MKKKQIFSIVLLVFNIVLLFPLFSEAQVRRQVGQTSGSGNVYNSISTSGFTTLWINKGNVYASGFNKYGQLGDNSTVDKSKPVQVLGLTNIVAVAVDLGHSMALRSDGTVWTWGHNFYGQLGIGNKIDSHIPVMIPDLNNVIGISTANNACFALKSDGTVWAWGDNQIEFDINDPLDDGNVHLGKLGLGQNYNGQFCVLTPVKNSILANIKEVCAGRVSSFALKSDGTVWAWGGNTYGQLGIGMYSIGTQSPIQTKVLKDIIQISAGFNHFIALSSSGQIYACGDNSFYQLGYPTPAQDPSSNEPQMVHNFLAGKPGGIYLNKIINISSGPSYNLALMSDGTVVSWGETDFGCLGLGNTGDPQLGYGKVVTNDNIPANSFLGDIIAVFASNSSPTSMALKSDGSIWAWGDNQYGAFGNGWSGQPFDPNASNYHAKLVHVLSPSGSSIASGAFHSLELISNGTVNAWGRNDDGQLGYGVSGVNANQNYPVFVEAIGGAGSLWGVCAISGGGSHSLALLSTGKLLAWGNNYQGQLGDGTINSSSTPVVVKNSNLIDQLDDVVAIASPSTLSGNHNLVLRSDGTVLTWGNNTNGQLGNGQTGGYKNVPIQVNNLNSAIAIAAGQNFSLALKADGTVWAWGSNNIGQLGNGFNGPGTDQNIPVMVVGLNNIVAIAAGGSHGLALKSDGTVWAWGSNQAGQLGNGTTTFNNAPSKVMGGFLYPYILPFTNIKAIGAGNLYSRNTDGENSSALSAGGIVYSWGSNSSFQLGIGNTSTTPKYYPTKAEGVTDVKSISNISSHAIILHSDGTVCVVGDNTFGQLGNNYFGFETGIYDCSLNKPKKVVAKIKANKDVLNSNPKTLIYPNPVSQELKIAFPLESDSRVETYIISSLGKRVYSSSETLLAGNNNKSINVKSLSQGTYFIKIITNANTYSQKIIILH